MIPGDRVEVRCFDKTLSGPTAKWKPGTVLGAPPNEWLVQLDDGGHVHPIQIASMRPLGIPVEAQPDSVHGVGSFWGGLARLANPLSSPLSPIGQTRAIRNMFRGGGGARPSRPPPRSQPRPSPTWGGGDPSQEDGGAQSPYASPTSAPGGDWNQYQTPGSSWDAFGGPTDY